LPHLVIKILKNRLDSPVAGYYLNPDCPIISNLHFIN